MTLLELSAEYRHHANQLKERVDTLEQEMTTCTDTQAKFALEDRVRVLGIMLREARELAVLTERYYERGYRRSAKYTL